MWTSTGLAPENRRSCLLAARTEHDEYRTSRVIRAPPSTAGTSCIRPVDRRLLDDRPPKPDRVWNRIPDDVRERIIRLAPDQPALSPRELAVRFTDTEGYFGSEASVYRLLQAHDLIASPVFIVMKAANEFKDKTTAPNQLRQLKALGWLSREPRRYSCVSLSLAPDRWARRSGEPGSSVAKM